MTPDIYFHTETFLKPLSDFDFEQDYYSFSIN